MRTTLDIDEDILDAARDLARRQRRSIGAVLSALARQALTSGPRPADEVTFLGFRPFPSRGFVVSDELVDRIRDEEGV